MVYVFLVQGCFTKQPYCVGFVRQSPTVLIVLQYCQTFPLQMRLHVAIQLSIRHFYTPSTGDLKQPDLTSGLYERVYTHTHCVSALWAMTDLMLPNTHCDVCQTLVSIHTCSSYILFNCSNNKHVTYMEFILASKRNSTPFFVLFY